METVRDLQQRGVTLKSIRGHHGAFVHDTETRGGDKFFAGESVVIGHSHKGRLYIEAVERLPNGCLRAISGVHADSIYYSGIAPPPPPKKPKRGTTWTCPGPLCERMAHRSTAFRECCCIECWMRAHADLTKKIIRDHYRKTA